MHVEVLSYGYAAQSSRQARPSVWSRVAERVRTIGVTYELDDHLARDIGAKAYTVPVFPAANQGEWR
jgi:hypothetical protein